ncbi:RteC domain-containing protein [Mesonia sp. K7]|uniref:RteC domain-containing protein n=1 Tax=Mesonia sp. K7 TaxID=2218606 RepID=UPI000DA8957C|nr:RteC domain-containing protein [Mesonia sp. K7]PZD76814.1 hypothetical protein DNG35_10680 [Mesonia sp. K7]
MKTLSHLLKEFQEELRQINISNHNIMKKANLSIVCCNSCLHKMRKQIEIVKIDSKDDEINFFKNIKSEPLVSLIYYREVRSFELKIQNTPVHIRKRVIKKQLKKVYKFLQLHIETLQYINNNLNHLDHIFFTRTQEEHTHLFHKGSYFFDPQFNTSKDQLFAKTKAYLKFMKYLKAKKKMINNPNQSINILIESNLQWTASKVALVEIIYALYHKKAINNGNVDIKQIAVCFQSLFNIEIGDYYKIFAEIKNRQNNHTKYLDELSHNLKEHIRKS